METQHTQSGPKNITLNLDEFDIDSYDFKPVTKGLGFHGEKEKKIRLKTTLSNKSLKTTRAMPQTTPSLGVSHLQNIPATVTDTGLMTGVEAIYKKNEDLTQPKTQEAVRSRKKLSLKEASLFAMAVAFLFDVLLITTIALSLFACFYFFAAGSFDLPLFMMFIKNSRVFVALMFSLIFLSYFSLLEPVGTPGKKSMKLGTFQVGKEKRITIKNAFLRALISLFSIPLLAFPLVFDFQGKLSDSKVMNLKK